MKSLVKALTLCLVAFLLSPTMASAFTDDPNIADDPFAMEDPFTVLAQKKKLTESEAAKRAVRQHGGKVVSVVCREQNDRTYCSVKLDIDGRIKTVTIR